MRVSKKRKLLHLIFCLGRLYIAYRFSLKYLNIRTPNNIAVNTLKLQLAGVMAPKDSDGIANSEDPDPIAPLGAV